MFKWVDGWDRGSCVCVCVCVCVCTLDQTKSHLKSLIFLMSVLTCGFTNVGFFWTILPLFLLGTFSRLACVPLSGLMSMQLLKNNTERQKYFSFRWYRSMNATYQIRACSVQCSDAECWTTLKRSISHNNITRGSSYVCSCCSCVRGTIGYHYRLLDNGVVRRKVNQVKLCGAVNVKKKLPLNEFQRARCIMLVLKVEDVVGGEDYSKPKHKGHSFT